MQVANRGTAHLDLTDTIKKFNTRTALTKKVRMIVSTMSCAMELKAAVLMVLIVLRACNKRREGKIISDRSRQMVLAFAVRGGIIATKPSLMATLHH